MLIDVSDQTGPLEERQFIKVFIDGRFCYLDYLICAVAFAAGRDPSMISVSFDKVC